MSKTFEGKVALVTGGATGMGQATALAFGLKGAKVVIADISEDGGNKARDILRDNGIDAMFIKTNVSKALEVKALIKQTIEAYGRLDCAFNNAGIDQGQATIANLTEEEFDRVVGINFKGVWLCMKYEIPHMLKIGAGAIVNTSSVNGLIGSRFRASYAASKHAVIGLTKSAALDYATSNIRINAICPGLIDTPMAQRFFKGDAQKMNQMVSGFPMGRAGSPNEIAQVVTWLCSDESSFITGHALTVDGGQIA